MSRWSAEIDVVPERAEHVVLQVGDVPTPHLQGLVSSSSNRIGEEDRALVRVPGIMAVSLICRCQISLVFHIHLIKAIATQLCRSAGGMASAAPATSHIGVQPWATGKIGALPRDVRP